MPNLDEANLVLAAPQRLHDPVDAVPGQPEDTVSTPHSNSVSSRMSPPVLAMIRSFAIVDRSTRHAAFSESMLCHGALAASAWRGGN